MPKTRGLHLKNFRDFIREKYGSEGLRKVLAGLDPTDREIADQPVLINQWYDAEVWWRMLMALDRVLGQGDFQLVRECAAHDARESLGGVYKLFIKHMSPEMSISAMPMIYVRYYDTGKLVVTRLEKNRAEVRLANYPGVPQHHEEELIAWAVAALQMCGAENIHLTHSTCIARGDAYCTFGVTWEKNPAK
jgi:hypothetical protein